MPRLAALVVCAAACGNGAPRPKLTEIETTYDGVSGLVRSLVQLDYADDRLETMSMATVRWTD